jgi:hypothetical protein
MELEETSNSLMINVFACLVISLVANAVFLNNRYLTKFQDSLVLLKANNLNSVLAKILQQVKGMDLLFQTVLCFHVIALYPNFCHLLFNITIHNLRWAHAFVQEVQGVNAVWIVLKLHSWHLRQSVSQQIYYKMVVHVLMWLIQQQIQFSKDAIAASNIKDRTTLFRIWLLKTTDAFAMVPHVGAV